MLFFLVYLANTLNLCLMDDHFPNKFKSGIISSIYKQDYALSEILNYRAGSMTKLHPQVV